MNICSVEIPESCAVGKGMKRNENIVATYLKFDKIYKHANPRSLINLKQDNHTPKTNTKAQYNKIVENQPKQQNLKSNQ